MQLSLTQEEESKRIKFKTVPDLPVLRMPIRDLPQVNFGEEATLGGNQTPVITSPTRGKGQKAHAERKKKQAPQESPNVA